MVESITGNGQETSETIQDTPEVQSGANQGSQDVLSKEVAFPFIHGINNDYVDLSILLEQEHNFSWFDKMAAGYDEALPQQTARNFLTARNFISKGMEAVGESLPTVDVSDSMSSTATMQANKLQRTKEIEQAISSIRTAKELNKQYGTDAFKYDMDENLAEDYLYNVQRRNKNEYIMNSGSGLGIGSQLLLGAASFAEPTNLATSLMMGPILKGATFAKVLAGLAVEAGVSTTIAEVGQSVGSGRETSVESIAIQTGMGVALGGVLHYGGKALAKRMTKSPKDMADLATKTIVPENKTQATLNKIITDASPENKALILNQIAQLADTDAHIDLEAIRQEALPNIDKEVAQEVQTEMDLAFKNNGDDGVIFYGEGTDDLSYSYHPTNFEEEVENALLAGKNSVTVNKVPRETVVDFDGTELRELPDEILAKIDEHPILGKILKEQLKENPDGFMPVNATFKGYESELLPLLKEFAPNSNIHLDGKMHMFSSDALEKTEVKLPKNIVKNEPKPTTQPQSSAVFKSGDSKKILEEFRKEELKDFSLVELENEGKDILEIFRQNVENDTASPELMKMIENLHEADQKFAKENSVLKIAVGCLLGGKK